MRSLWLAVLLVPGSAHAEVSIGAAVGAGAQGASTYSSLELRFDAQGDKAHLGLGVRGVWDDRAFRDSEWASPWAAVTLVRDASLAGTVGDTELAAAAGALAPAHVGHVADGYRATLDDRWRTGVRTAAHSSTIDAAAEIDDVLDPRFVAASASWLMAAPWGMHAAVAMDPGAATAVEVGGFHRYQGDAARLDIGVSMIAEPAPTGVVFADAAFDRVGARWTLRGDVRAGNDGLFGPLYRIEGVDDANGFGAGLTAGIASERGWLELGARRRAGLGGLYTASAGAPMSRWAQAAVWAAATRDTAVGAAELRVAWSRSLFSALRGARMLETDAMQTTPVWMVTAWFGAATR
jgi:hypothetical protein